MTTEELRALIAECEDPDMANSYLLMPDLAELARDALRFQWLLARYAETEAAPDTPDVWLHFIGWARELRTADIRAAIDDGMRDAADD